MAMNNLYENYLDAMDPRVEDWPLMSSIAYPIAIIICYLLIFYVIGPEFMKNREIFKVQPFLRYYNPFLVTVNGVFGFVITMDIHRANYSFICQAVDYNGGPIENELASLIWIFHLIKIFELIDTVMLIVTKRELFDQNSVLHIYHHATMVIGTWIAAKFVPGGFTAYVAVINSYVHVLVYLYHKVRANSPRYALWFQIWLLQVQFVQFVMIGVMCGLTIWYPCNFPTWFSWGLLVYVVIFLVWMYPFFHYVFLRRGGA